MKVHGNGKEEAFYAYDENGNRSYMKLGNGIETEYTYNNANLIKSLKNKNNEELLSSYGYTYYLDGNQESKTDNKGVSTTYVYDNLGRLTSERQTAQDKDTNWAYEYDEAHNRSKMTVNRNGEPEVTDYTYDKNNRLLREMSINAASGVKTLSSYAYDNNGNQLSKMSDVIAPADISLDASLRIYILGDYSKSEDGESFNNSDKQGLLELNTYDVFNRLRTVRREGVIAEYGYRADGLRILKTVNGETTAHVWDGSNMVADLDSSLDVKDIYIRGINLISSEENGYYVYNAHGDVVQLSDSTGSITKEYVYDAFGVEEDIDEADENLFRYCAEYFDKETGNIYLRARYYDPATSRMLSEDPIRAGLNWYTYCGNNPIAFIDPLGLDAILVNKRIEAGPGADHMSAFFQDKNDDWYFFFYGDTVYMEKITDLSIFDSLDAMNEYLWAHDLNLNSDKDGPGKAYHSSVYVKGDFVASYDKAAWYVKKYNDAIDDGTMKVGPINSIMKVKNGDYNLFTNNCGQVTIGVFSLGTLPDGTNAGVFSYPQGGTYGNEAILPNMHMMQLQGVYKNKALNLDGFNSAIDAEWQRYNNMNGVMKWLNRGLPGKLNTIRP